MICIDCQRSCVATIVQYARLHSGELRSWHICYSCAERFERVKDAAAREWKERSDELRAAFARIPFGQVNPATIRKQVRG